MIMVFEIGTEMSIDDLIEFVFIVKVHNIPGQFTVDVLIKVLKLLNDAFDTKSNFFRQVRRR